MAEAIATIVSAAPEPAAAPAAARDSGGTDTTPDGGFSFPQALSRHLDQGGTTTAPDKPATDPAADDTSVDGKKLPPDSAVLAALLLGAPVAPATDPAGASQSNTAPAGDGAATDPAGAALLAALLPAGQVPGPMAATDKTAPTLIGARSVSPAVPLGNAVSATASDPATGSADPTGANPSAATDAQFDPAALLAGAAAGGERADAAPNNLLTEGNEQAIRPAGFAAVAAGAAHTEASARPALTIPLPPTHPDWGNELGQRVLWMTNQQIAGAELKLSPPELGPLSVQISLDSDQARIQFNANQPLVREAIESALPRLREMLAGAGINLADVSVSQHGFTQAQQDHGQSGPGARADQAGGGEPLPAPPPRVMLGLLDLYA